MKTMIPLVGHTNSPLEVTSSKISPEVTGSLKYNNEEGLEKKPSDTTTSVDHLHETPTITPDRDPIHQANQGEFSLSAEKLLQSTIIQTTERAEKQSSTSLSKILGIPTNLNNAGVDIASLNNTVITDSSLEIIASPTMPTSSVYNVRSETVKKQILGNTDKSDSTDTYPPNGDQNEHPQPRKVVDSATATYVPNVDQEMDENITLLFTSEMSTSVEDHDHRPTQEIRPKPGAEGIEYQHSHHQESNSKGSSSAPNGEGGRHVTSRI